MAQIFDSKLTCIDPLAKIVLMESMAYAIEKATKMTSNLGRIYSGLEDKISTEKIGDLTLSTIQQIRLAIEMLPPCGVTTLIEPPAPSSEAKKAIKDVLTKFTPEEKRAVTEAPENQQEILTRAIVATKDIKVPKYFERTGTEPVRPAKEEKKKSTRTTAAGWGSVIYSYEGKDYKYGNPGEFADLVYGMKAEGKHATEGADSQDKFFTSKGWKLENLAHPGEAIKKGDGLRFIWAGKGPAPKPPKPRPVEPTESVPETKAEKAANPKFIAPTDKPLLDWRKAAAQYRLPWTQVNKAGSYAFFEDADGKQVPMFIVALVPAGTNMNKIAPKIRDEK